ncbi:MAG: hypothetical protein ACKPJ4_11795, partial [Dolichospermum sp.]
MVKFAGEKLATEYQTILNRILSGGLPREWRTARVIAIPKKPGLQSIENHRPISNLNGMEKLFEKCILN